MRKLLNFCMVLTAALFLAGCGNDFEPTESTIYVTSKGEVVSAIMEDFDKAYYDFDELSENVYKEVRSYCLDINDEAIFVESLTKVIDSNVPVGQFKSCWKVSPNNTEVY